MVSKKVANDDVLEEIRENKTIGDNQARGNPGWYKANER